MCHAARLLAGAGTSPAEPWDVDGIYTMLYRHTFAERGISRGFVLAGGAGGIGARHRKARAGAPWGVALRAAAGLHVPLGRVTR